MLEGAKDREKADYYYYKGQAFLGTGENVPVEDLKTAGEAFKKAKEFGKSEAEEGLANVTNALVRSAIDDQNAEKYSKAAEKLYAGYQISKKDTVYLYFAASNAVNAGDYDTALKYYENLRDMGYTGIETQYIAVSKETGEEEVMTREQRDLLVKTGQYVDPEDRVTPSRAGEIIKNMALIYMSEGEEEKALTAIEEAKKANPDDIALRQAEADLYYKMGNKQKYRELMQEVVNMDPDNANLYYNLGVSAYETGDIDAAINYYKKALELQPDMNNARLNIVAAILSQEEEIVNEMNSLGLSKADTEKYDKLAEKRKELYRRSLPYLEELLDRAPENMEALRTTMNIYYQLGENKKAEKLQEKITALQG
jgi:tetratricopeptide (TPR) repeat protein